MLCDYELIPGYWKNSYEYDSEHPNSNEMFSVEDTQNLRFCMRCQSIQKSEHFDEFQNGTFKLIEGRHSVPEDKHTVIISKELARKNCLKLGDTFKIRGDSFSLGTGYPALPLGLIETKIVGIFEMTYNQGVSKYTNEYDILENWILVDNETGYDLNEIYGDTRTLGVCQFFVENPAELDKVMEEVNSLDGIDWQYYELRKDDSMYNDAVKPLDTVRKIMFICICTIVTTGILVFLLVITHSMKKRTRETGILMSLGVTEKEIEAVIARGEQSKASEMAKNQKTGVQPPEELNTRIGVRSILIVFIVMILIIYFCVNGVIKKTLKLEPIRVLSMIE